MRRETVFQRLIEDFYKRDPHALNHYIDGDRLLLETYPPNRQFPLRHVWRWTGKEAVRESDTEMDIFSQDCE